MTGHERCLAAIEGGTVYAAQRVTTIIFRSLGRTQHGKLILYAGISRIRP